ncbi:hypothetical protein ACQUFY_08925 [Robbsia andropogonis]|uniref:hypothetical protein n=1 Tax=Robbsia andropogonis TaxID=28092 RepID=UPI003D1B9A12
MTAVDRTLMADRPSAPATLAKDNEKRRRVAGARSMVVTGAEEKGVLMGTKDL